MGRPPQPTPEKLLGHHVKYEIDQMVAALKMLGRLKVPPDWQPQEGWQKALNNALMEDFYLHARALFEFFQDRKGARKYTEASYKPFEGIVVKEWVRQLNNQAAHVLEGRTDDDNLKMKDQDKFDMLNALSDELEAFRKALKSEYQSIAIPSIPKMMMLVSGQTPGATNVIGEIK